MIIRTQCFVQGVSALMLALLTSACAGNVAAPSGTVATSGASSAATAALVGGVWKLQSITHADSTTVTVRQPDLFTLELTDTRIALRVDCNRATGPYTTNGTTLTVGRLAMTRAYCADTADVGDEYLRGLDGDTVVSATSTSLVLSSARGTLQFGK